MYKAVPKEIADKLPLLQSIFRAHNNRKADKTSTVNAKHPIYRTKSSAKVTQNTTLSYNSPLPKNTCKG